MSLFISFNYEKFTSCKKEWIWRWEWVRPKDKWRLPPSIHQRECPLSLETKTKKFNHCFFFRLERDSPWRLSFPMWWKHFWISRQSQDKIWRKIYWKLKVILRIRFRQKFFQKWKKVQVDSKDKIWPRIWVFYWLLVCGRTRV